MELVYLWVEDYKNIHKQGFNFSPRFHCEFKDEYDEDGKLKDNCELVICDKKNKECEDNNYIEDFFGDNINVTAIVGKNGSGKSSVVESLQAINIINPIEGESNFISKYILILKVDKDSFKNDDFLSVQENIQIKTNINILNYIVGEEFNENIDFLFEHLFFDAELPYNKFNEYEIVSENFHVIPEFEHTKEYVYIDLDYYSISKKLLQIDNTYLFNTLDFIPETLTIKPNDSTLEKSRNFIVYDYHKRPRFSDVIIEKVDEIIERIHDGKDFFTFRLFLSKIDNFEDKERVEILDKINSNENIVEILKPYLEQINTEINLAEYETLLTENIKISDVNIPLLIKYFEYLDIEIFDGRNRSFNNLSHGEKMFFGVVVNISYFHKESRNNNFLLCFDEPDLSLHPNWQKRYINEVCSLLKQINRKIHFIFTTHSPFLLSDIPKQNIIFLDKDENGNCKVVDGLKDKKQTFGQNIHTLLSDSFFMEDGLMGEFAKERIENVIKLLKSKRKLSQKNKKLCEDTISIIGEPFLKSKLEKMYEAKFPKTQEEKIAELKAEIERLENGSDKT